MHTRTNTNELFSFHKTYESTTMSLDVQAYTVMIMEEEKYGARPLLVGVFTPSGEFNFSESCLRKAGPFNNKHIFTKRINKRGEKISMEEADIRHRSAVEAAISRFNQKSDVPLPNIDMLPFPPLTGPEFINIAIRVNLMSAGTVEHCMEAGSTSALPPQLPGSLHTEAAQKVPDQGQGTSHNDQQPASSAMYPDVSCATNGCSPLSPSDPTDPSASNQPGQFDNPPPPMGNAIVCQAMEG